jgi:ribosomal protein L29
MLTDLKKELFTLAFFFKASSPAKEADWRVKVVKRDIARIKTILNNA